MEDRRPPWVKSRRDVLPFYFYAIGRRQTLVDRHGSFD
jgi:hypothetical protein